jgi:hypothetical protein
LGGEAPDPLLLGHRVAAALKTGLRTATYELATLMAPRARILIATNELRDAVAIKRTSVSVDIAKV